MLKPRMSPNALFSADTLNGKMRRTVAEQREAQERASSEAATIKMAGEALEALGDRQWIDVITVSLETRIGGIDLQQLRQLAHYMDQRVDEEERNRA